MKIVSLDDHPLFSNGLKASLSTNQHGFDVTITHSAKEALNHLQAHQDIDLLILDLTMPDMDGLSFMKALIARDIDVPVVIMSAKEDLIIIKEALKLGALGFLPKSWPVDELADALISIDKGELVIPKHIATGLSNMSKKAIEKTQTTLSHRQLEILTMVQAGLSNQAISEILYISLATVKSHLQTVFKILGAKNRIDSVRKAEHLNIIQKTNN